MFFRLSVLLAIAFAIALVIRFYGGGDLPPKSPTEYEKAQQSQSQSAEPPSSSKGEAEIHEANVETPKETASKLVRAWNQGSGKEIANLFTADGVLTIPDGSEIQSKSEIEKILTEKHGDLINETTLSNSVDEVSEIDANTAVVKGRYQLSGLRILGLSTTTTGTFVMHQLKSGKKWLISKAELRNGDAG